MDENVDRIFSPGPSRSMAQNAGLHHSETQNEEQLYLMEHMMDLAEGDYHNDGTHSNDASRLAL